jgi:two-component sensor histidine kinase
VSRPSQQRLAKRQSVSDLKPRFGGGFRMPQNFWRPEILLSPKLALTMALLFHELATNAAKYGALSHWAGKISVRWSHSDPWLNLEWRESEGPPVTVPNHRGFGTRLFLRALEQFGGKVEAIFASTGLVCKLSVPLSERAPSIVPPASDAPAVIGADARPKIT